MNYSTCNYCNVVFERKRKTKQFCGLECKNKFNYALNNGLEIPARLVEAQLGDNSRIMLDQRKVIDHLRNEITLLKDKVRFYESQIGQKTDKQKASEIHSHYKVDLPSQEDEGNVGFIQMNENKDSKMESIPFLKKKERICEALLEQGIQKVSLQDLKALDYPCGFFDGWKEEGESLKKYKLVWDRATEMYGIHLID